VQAGDDRSIFLSILPATDRDRKTALAVVGVSAVLFAFAAYFATVPLTPVPAFVASYQSALAVNDLITAVLLFSQFAVLRSRALLLLGSGYLFTAAAAIVGPLIARLRGVYFAMCTIAFGQLWYYLAYSWNDFTGGFDGLRDFHREPIGIGPLTFDITQGETRFYFFLLAMFAAAVGLMGLLLRSPFGRTLLAIRENERRARFLGIPVERHIWLSFSISCFIAALAGTLYALLNNFADPLTLHYSLSGYFVVMTVTGGMRTFWGPLVGAALFVLLQDYISSMTVNWMFFIGLMFILVVLFFPRGILGMRRAAARHASAPK